VVDGAIRAVWDIAPGAAIADGYLRDPAATDGRVYRLSELANDVTTLGETSLPVSGGPGRRKLMFLGGVRLAR
jgi:hypothetical protein